MEEEKINQTKQLEISEEDPNNPSTPKTIDIYQHLKINFKNSILNKCQCFCNKPPILYCIPCKISICNDCSTKDHIDHLMTTKKYKELNKSDINAIFNETEKCLNSSSIYSKNEQIKMNLIEKIELFSSEMISKINKYKQIKLEEIEQLFNTMISYSNKTKEKINVIKQELNDYYDKTKRFYLHGDNNDESNTLFLLNYDIINIVYQKTRLIKGISDHLINDYQNYEANENKARTSTLNQLDSCLFDKANKENLLKNQWKINDNYNPMFHFNYCCDKLNEDHFNIISLHIKKYIEQIEAFKIKVFELYSKTHNFREIDKHLHDYELSSKLKGSDNLFTKRPPLTAKQTESTISGGVDRRIGKTKIEIKDDICLNNPSVKRYFSYLMIEFYDNNFRTLSKELQSSHADLLIKIDPEIEETIYVKIIEGTNMISIYYRKNQKMTKKKLSLTKNPFGYTVFPIGCRHILLGDKLYITGGKDEQRVYPTVIIYDLQSGNLKRIMDLREPRSYHTLVFNDAFDTLMVFGGEMTNSVEIFDPTVNRWQYLPWLNYPRAKSLFHFDKPRGIMYSMFGNEGKIMENKYSDVIEYLDLTQLTDGWNRLDYYNKSKTNLRTLINVFPLNSSVLLVYGGMSARKNRKNVCILNLEKKEIDIIDKELFEQLRIESNKSNRLSSIVSAFRKDK